MPGRSSVATVYHEILHAYLYAVFLKDVNGILQIPDDHNEFVNKYLLLLNGALRTAFPSLSTEDCYALTWGGLENTNLYKKMSESEKIEITNIINKHKKSLPIGQRSGTYCN